MTALVIFDMDDVLCDDRRDIRRAHLAATAGITPEAVRAAIWGSGIEDAADAGQLDADAYLAACGQALGYPLSLEEWLAARAAAMIPRPGVLAMVAEVGRRARLAALTNNPTLVATHLDRPFPALPPLFGASFFTSAQLGFLKPDPRCFLACLDRLGVAPADALFIDDVAEHVAGAQVSGLAAWQFTSEAGLAEVLGARGLLRRMA